jgi:hypothetical protein
MPQVEDQVRSPQLANDVKAVGKLRKRDVRIGFPKVLDVTGPREQADSSIADKSDIRFFSAVHDSPAFHESPHAAAEDLIVGIGCRKIELHMR